MPWETIPFSYYQLQTYLSKPTLVANLFPVAVRPDNCSIDVEKMYNLIGDYMGDRLITLLLTMIGKQVVENTYESKRR